MPGVTMRIRIDDDDAMAALRDLQARGEDLTALLDEVGDILVSDAINNFEHGHGPDGTPWPVSRAARERGGLTLVDDNRLMNSITHAAFSDHVEVGSNLVYAGIHQFGGETGRNHATTLPARPYLGISPGAEASITGAVEDYLAAPLEARA